LEVSISLIIASISLSPCTCGGDYLCG
jgi:hypothetical protein